MHGQRVLSRSDPLLGSFTTDTLGLSVFLSWLCLKSDDGSYVSTPSKSIIVKEV